MLLTPTLEQSSSSAAPSRIAAYRPDIDGLRAFSILAVVIYHAFPQLLRGGFIGVDVFFVISGFLISGIILKSLNSGSFSFATFYSRRIKRIFPALIVVLGTSMLAGWLFLFPDEWEQMGKHAFAGAVFLSNIALMRDGGYFDSAVKPLLHLWSLGIEEQFYIVWPLLLVVAWKRRSMTLLSILLVLFVSFTLNVWYVGKRQAEVFYFPGTRFWELAVGALLAYLTLFQSGSKLFRLLRKNEHITSALSIAGLALLVASLVLITGTKAFPGAWALLPTTGAFLTIAAGPEAWFNKRLLSAQPMVFFGLISYPLYLWHWPILFFANILSPAGMTWQIAVLAVLASIGLSYCTYRIVETPLRHHRSVVAVPCLLAILMGCIGLWGLSSYRNGRPRLQVQSAKNEQFLAALADRDYPTPKNFRKFGGFGTLKVNGRGDEEVLFVGDSHAEQYFGRVKALTKGHEDQLPTSVFATYGGCPALPGVDRFDPGYACNKFFEHTMKRARDPHVKTVVFSAWWEAYLDFTAGGGSSKSVYAVYRTGDDKSIVRTSKQITELELVDFGSLIKSLRSSGKRVFIILSNPVSGLYNPESMMSRITGAIKKKDLDLSTLKRNQPNLDKLKAVCVQSGAIVIDPVPYLCGSSTCRTTDDAGLPRYRDNDHLRSSYAASHAVWIDQIYNR